MTPTFMFVAGEPSGDLLAAELVTALKTTFEREGGKTPVFFGAAGSKAAAAGVALAFDLTQHAVIGLWDVLANLRKFRRLLDDLVQLALERRPDAIVCVDFSGFNRRLGRAIRRRQREIPGWKPRLIQFVSPQVWASRPGRARQMARDFDLLLTIFPFEKAWYAEHTPALRVEFVGHPMIDRYGVTQSRIAEASSRIDAGGELPNQRVLLLPGSRAGELRRHLPMVVEAARLLPGVRPVSFQLVVPNEPLLALGRELTSGLSGLEIRVGGLEDALSKATIALASTGTITMECAFFGVPTVTFYKTNWLTYEIARRIVTVKSLTMPNLLAGETVYPEFVQHDASPERIAAAAGELLDSPDRRARIRKQLVKVVDSLGGPGACARAAEIIRELVMKA